MHHIRINGIRCRYRLRIDQPSLELCDCVCAHNEGKYLRTESALILVQKIYEFMCVIDWGSTQYWHICSEKICSRRQRHNVTSIKRKNQPHATDTTASSKRSHHFKREKLTIEIRLIHIHCAACAALRQAATHTHRHIFSLAVSSLQSFLFYYFHIAWREHVRKMATELRWRRCREIINKIDIIRMVKWVMEVPIGSVTVDL